MTEERVISIDDLVLDPNNPRFVRDLHLAANTSDEEVEGIQERVLARFSTTGDAQEGSGDFFDIGDLRRSMRAIGFVPIDRIVVRKLRGSDKYLVVEGNRRIAAAESLRREDAKEANPDNRLPQPILESLERIETLVIETEGRSEEQVAHRVSVILGFGITVPYSSGSRFQRPTTPIRSIWALSLGLINSDTKWSARRKWLTVFL